MKLFNIIIMLFSSCSIWAEAYKPELFKSIKLVYEDDFSKDGKPDPKQWKPQHNSSWVIKDNHLIGSPAPKEFQEEKLASGDAAHAGLKPVVFLKNIPENFVFQTRIKYEGEFVGNQRYQMLFGHHLQDVKFGKKDTVLTLHNDKEKVHFMEDVLVSPGKWVEITAELKDGHFILIVDGIKKTFEDPIISMSKSKDKKSLQIDFKGLNHGEVVIDWVKVYKGVR